MIVTNATMFNGNPYQDLLYSALEGRYEAVKGTFDDAVDRLRQKESKLLHVHWEENPLRKCTSTAEARLVTNRLSASLHEFKKLGGKLIWTLHNRLPHELEYTDELMELRRNLAECSDRVLVHSTTALAALREQVDVGLSKYMLFPHPTYAGIYPQRTDPSTLGRNRNALLFFGLLREYKGLDLLVEALTPLRQSGSRLTVQVRGNVLPNDPYADTVRGYGNDPGIDLDIGRVPDEVVSPLFESAGAVVMPYTRFLTSGVAMLALTFGCPIIAPDSPQMRELLPAENHSLLFALGDVQSLRDALRVFEQMDGTELEAIHSANLIRAKDHHPRLVSEGLGRLYDALLGKDAPAIPAAAESPPSLEALPD